MPWNDASFAIRGVLGVLVAIGTGARPTLARQPDKQPETLIRLSVSPAPAPKPALRYQLLPELKEMNPGNPIEGYLKCYLEQYRFAFDEAGFAERDELCCRCRSRSFPVPTRES